jgi:serine/threonine-protein kinase
MAMVMGSGEGMSQESAFVLRRRLGIAALIAFLPNLYFLLLSVIDPASRPDWFGITGLVFDLLVTIVAGSLAVLLWSRRPLQACTLRLLELVLFGSVAAFFAWLHVKMLARPECLDWLKPDLRSECIQQQLTIVLVASAMRWFFLIVLYGVFIPNTWKRCTLFVGSTALAALLLTVIPSLMDERLRAHLPRMVMMLTMILMAASAIAIFGSRRISTLQQEASKFRKLGQYRLQERLGTGGMGEVYMAEHVLLRRPCAIKLIHPELSGDARQLSRFEREVRAMATLTHWNTVEVFDYGHTEDGVFYYVMEYLPGQNLDTLVTRNGPLPPGRVVHLLRQVCLALREAHGIGLLHRDIKPSNIIACHRGGFHDVVKLLDFGLVQDQGLNKELKLTIQGTILGSPPFMSPEQSRGRDLTSASDIYGVGAVAYFLLTGQPPFVRETVMELLIAHANDPVTPPREHRPDIPHDLEAVVLRCLDKNLDKRFADAESLEKALASCSCAGEWTEEMAAEWWRTHGETVSVVPPESVPTKALTSVSV